MSEYVRILASDHLLLLRAELERDALLAAARKALAILEEIRTETAPEMVALRAAIAKAEAP